MTTQNTHARWGRAGKVTDYHWLTEKKDGISEWICECLFIRRIVPKTIGRNWPIQDDVGQPRSRLLAQWFGLSIAQVRKRGGC